jgi:hypothetical protein
MKERRSIARHKSFIQGRVYFNHRQSSTDCTIRDFTDTGARLQFPETTALPDAFEVYVPSKEEYFLAHVVWHKAGDIGVAWSPEGVKATHSFRSTDPIADRLAKLEHEVAVLRKRMDAIQA